MGEVTDADSRLLSRCEASIGHVFRDRDLLAAALTHASTKVTSGRSNERLEFLGDAVLGVIVSRILFDEHPDFEEGRMTKARAQVVSRKSLAEIGREMGLKEFLVVGKMFATRDHIAASVLSNALEAVVAAVYLDGGIEAAERFVRRHFGDAIERAANEPVGHDWKSQLSQWAQAQALGNPHYVLISTAGADHVRTFELCVTIGRRRFAAAFGRSKKEAEQRAARLALHELGLI